MSDTFLEDLCPELQCHIANFLDEPNKVSLHLTSSHFQDLVEFPKSVRGANICIACISGGYIDLFRYWLLTENIPIRGKANFVTDILSAAATVVGGSSPGETSKTLSNQALSIILERWYLKPSALEFDILKIAMAAALPDDVDHYQSITLPMKLSPLQKSNILVYTIRRGCIRVADLLCTNVPMVGHSPVSINSQNIIRYIKYAVYAGQETVRWVMGRCSPELRDESWRDIWESILNEAIKRDVVGMVDVLVDKSLFPMENDEEYLSIIENLGTIWGLHKKSEFVINFVTRIPILVKNHKILGRLVSRLGSGIKEEVKTSIKNLISCHYTPEEVHEQVLKTESLSTLVKAGLYFPTVYTPEFTTKLLVMMVHNRRRDPLNLEALSASIKLAFEEAWTQFANKPEKQLYLATIVLSTSLVSPNVILDKLVSTYAPKPAEESIPEVKYQKEYTEEDEIEEEDEGYDGEGYDSGEWSSDEERLVL